MHDSDLFTNIGLGFRRAFDFSGRSCRSEFWCFHLFYMLIFLLLNTIVASSTPELEFDTAITGTTLLSLLVFGIPSTSLFVRRVHDIGGSGVYAFIPIVNIIMAIIESDEGENKYGDPCVVVLTNPKNEQLLEADETFKKLKQSNEIAEQQRAEKQRLEAINKLKQRNEIAEKQRLEQSKQFIESSQICGFCEFGNRPNATFCGGCGKPLGDIICTNCQFENPNIASFCEGCGKELATS